MARIRSRTASARGAASDDDDPAAEAQRWVTFLAQEGGPVALTPPLPEGSTLDDFRVTEVNTVRGPRIPIEPGWRLHRIEGSAPLQSLGRGLALVGVAQHPTYTSAAEGRRLRAVERREPGDMAVLVPIRKSDEWWRLGQDQRLALFRGSRPQGGHVAIGMRFAARVLRRLYHARYLPGSAWDFLAYFELDAADAGAIRELLAAMRDPHESSAWQFVECESEIWLRR
jgi:hypothetical protein